jgi:hypothetical protein
MASLENIHNRLGGHQQSALVIDCLSLQFLCYGVMTMGAMRPSSR